MICKKCGHTVPDTENICPICCSPVERDGDQKYKRSKQYENKGSGGIKKVKELPAKTKRTIIISAAFAAAVGLMLFLIFGVIIPAATPKTDISKNLTVVFDSKTQYDGSLSGDISLNREAAMKELSNEGLDEIVLAGVVDRLLYYADLEYKTQDGYSSGKSRNSVHFNDLGSTDEISVEITWPDDAESKEKIAREEKASGITIDKSPKTIKVKLADYVKAYDIELKKANEVNVLDYINENDLIISVPVDNGITVGIDSFKTEIGGYVFENGSIYDTSVRVYNKNGELFSTVFFEFSETKDLKEGDTVTLSYSKNNRSADESGQSQIRTLSINILTKTFPPSIPTPKRTTILKSAKYIFPKTKKTGHSTSLLLFMKIKAKTTSEPQSSAATAFSRATDLFSTATQSLTKRLNQPTRQLRKPPV